MRIDRIDIIHVKNPFLHPFETSFTRFVERVASPLGAAVLEGYFSKL